MTLAIFLFSIFEILQPEFYSTGYSQIIVSEQWCGDDTVILDAQNAGALGS